MSYIYYYYYSVRKRRREPSTKSKPEESVVRVNTKILTEEKKGFPNSNVERSK
jgi:hypothetical protein